MYDACTSVNATVYLDLTPSTSRYIRIYPQTYNGYKLLRMELFGCPQGMLGLSAINSMDSKVLPLDI